MKSTELVELLQKHPEATVMHLMPYRMDDETVAPVHSPRFFAKGDSLKDIHAWFYDYDDIEYVDDHDCATMDLIILF